MAYMYHVCELKMILHWSWWSAWSSRTSGCFSTFLLTSELLRLRKKVSSLSVLWKPMIAQHSAPFQSEFSISPKYFAKVRNPIWNLACAMWNVLCKQCDGPEDPVCHEDLTFRPPDGSFESCESSTGEHSTFRRKPQGGKIYPNLFMKEFVGLHWFESTNH